MFALDTNGFQTTFPVDESVNQTINTSSPLTSNDFNNLSNQNNNQLFVYIFPLASLNQSYLVKVDHLHQTGLPLEISIVSANSQNKYLNTILDNTNKWHESWYIVPARQLDDFDSGINIIFNNKSLNNLPTTNFIKSVKLYPFPYSTLINQNSLTNVSKSVRTYLATKSNIFYYQAQLDNVQKNQFLVLPQSFSSGWLAFYFHGLRPVFLTNHILINNWANGWSLNTIYQSPYTIYIFFWPQLLEFLGFGLLVGTFILIIKKR